jgi:hypothetical protein
MPFFIIKCLTQYCNFTNDIINNSRASVYVYAPWCSFKKYINKCNCDNINLNEIFKLICILSEKLLKGSRI